MKRMKAFRPSPSAAVAAPEVVVHGRVLAPGVVVSVRGERGRFRFRSASVTSAGRVVCDFIGGPVGHESWRSFYPERIKTVHRVQGARL